DAGVEVDRRSGVPEERAGVAAAPTADGEAARGGDEAAVRPPAAVDDAEIDGAIVDLVEGDVDGEVARDGDLARRALAVAGERRLRERIGRGAEREPGSFDE